MEKLTAGAPIAAGQQVRLDSDGHLVPLGEVSRVTDEMVDRAVDGYMAAGGDFVKEMPMRAALEAALHPPVCEMCGEPAQRTYPGVLCEAHFEDFRAWREAKRRP